MWLSIDTSLDYFIVAVHDANRPSVGICLPSSDERTRVAYMFLDGFFKEHNIEMKSITKISVGIGPGPYIAVRTGVSLANGFAAGLGVKILPVCSPYIMQPEPDSQGIIYRRPARMNEEVWLALRKSTNGIETMNTEGNWKAWDYTAGASEIVTTEMIDNLAVTHQIPIKTNLEPSLGVENLITSTQNIASKVEMQLEISPSYLRPAR